MPSIEAGYGAIVVELSVEKGDIKALFLDISSNYGYLGTLDDNGPTLLYAAKPTDIGAVKLGEMGYRRSLVLLSMENPGSSRCLSIQLHIVASSCYAILAVYQQKRTGMA